MFNRHKSLHIFDKKQQKKNKFSAKSKYNLNYTVKNNNKIENFSKNVFPSRCFFLCISDFF